MTELVTWIADVPAFASSQWTYLPAWMISGGLTRVVACAAVAQTRAIAGAAVTSRRGYMDIAGVLLGGDAAASCVHQGGVRWRRTMCDARAPAPAPALRRWPLTRSAGSPRPAAPR